MLYGFHFTFASINKLNGLWSNESISMEANNCIYRPLYTSPIYDYLSENGNELFIQAQKEAVIFFVYSGELIISYNDEAICVKKGEYAFVKRGIVADINKRDIENEKFSGAYIGFDKIFLWWFYRKIYNPALSISNDKFEQSIIKLPYTPYMHSLYISLETYREYGRKPERDILCLKLQEGIYSLTMTDNRFYSCLFDFIYPCSHDIFNLLNNNPLNN